MRFWAAYKIRKSVAGYIDGYKALYLEDIFVETSDGPTSQHCVPRVVPQGSVLSSTLFLTLILIGLILPTNVLLSIYADDICIWASGVSLPQIRDPLQKAATLTCLFLRQQGLEISSEKCELVLSPPKQCHSVLFIKLTPYFLRQKSPVRFWEFSSIGIHNGLLKFHS